MLVARGVTGDKRQRRRDIKTRAELGGDRGLGACVLRDSINIIKMMIIK